MKVLLVAATSAELATVEKAVGDIESPHQVDFLVTGVGMVATAYMLTKRITDQRYDLVLNIGLAGSMDPSVPIGSVVAVGRDRFYELGAEDGSDFISAEKLGLVESSDIVPSRLLKHHPFRMVSAITVNKVHGDEATISRIAERCTASIESMEGAAFYLVCDRENVPCLQVRAVSNRVERRNRDAWRVSSSLERLAQELTGFLKDILR